MRAIKALLVGAVGLFIFITLLSLLIPSHPKVSRTVVINTPDKNNITAQLTDLTKWKNWHPAFSSDSVTVSFGKLTAGEGASCDIVYHNTTTHLAITKIDTTSITFELRSPGENDITNQVFVTTLQPVSQVKVDWMATTHLNWYPWEKFYAIFIDKITGPGYEAALQGLKKHVEKP